MPTYPFHFQLASLDSLVFPFSWEPSPGPIALPLLGHVHLLARKYPWETFTALAKQYGDVVYLHVLGRPFIVLNSVEAINDLFEGRPQIYSDRPFFPLMNLIGHDQWSLSLMPYGDKLRAQRRTVIKLFSTPAAMRTFYDAHNAVGITFLNNILRDPDNLFHYIRLRNTQLILDVTYGIQADSHEDPFVQTADAVMATFSLALSPPMWLINPALILKYLPDWLGGFATLRKWMADTQALRFKPYEHVQKSLAEGSARPSYVASLIQEICPVPGSEDETTIRDSAAAAYGGLYTISIGMYNLTVNTTEIFMLAMLLYPEVQKRAQEEIDRVVGPNRLPDFVDRSQLPYISAIEKEVLRWHPAGPIGVPHMLRQDDVYKGYYMPGGAMVLANIWGVLHDPEMYPDPMEFKPERFMRDGVFDCGAIDPSRIGAFGCGRRVCPGKLLAEDNLWLTVAQLLATFTISVPEGTKPPSATFTSEGISKPTPFKCVVRPRSQAAVELVEGALAAKD
ncbi:cytochrome P450 [Daedaleopsis nitida]|nr:cytochrome P450 [Daedaleopsis nitida]